MFFLFHLKILNIYSVGKIIFVFTKYKYGKNHGYRQGGKNVNKNPIRCVRVPLPESFEEDMKKIKKERD
jgi:hypothetical protein